MYKTYRLFVSLLATVFSLLSMVVGIMLVNSVTLSFWQMVCYDLIFLGQFVVFLWCGIVYYRIPEKEE